MMTVAYLLICTTYFPQSNGLAEAAIKNVIHLLKKNDRNFSKLKKALLMWKNMPSSAGPSPAQMMFGFTQNFGQGWESFVEMNRQAAKKRKDEVSTTKQKSFNKNAKDLGPILPDSQVLVHDHVTQAWNTKATILAVRKDGRSYVISCLLYTSPSPRDKRQSRMPSSA